MIHSIEYELTDDYVAQASLDLLDHRLARLKQKHPEWGSTRPLWLLGLAALQIIVAMAALVWIGDGLDSLAIALLILGGVALLVLMYKASFYVMPFLGRGLMQRQATRSLRELKHRRVTWTFYDDHLETRSAAVGRTIPWTEVTGLTHIGQSLILTWGQQDLIIPAALMNADVQQWVVERLKCKGARMSYD